MSCEKLRLLCSRSRQKLSIWMTGCPAISEPFVTKFSMQMHHHEPERHAVGFIYLQNQGHYMICKEIWLSSELLILLQLNCVSCKDHIPLNHAMSSSQQSFKISSFFLFLNFFLYFFFWGGGGGKKKKNQLILCNPIWCGEPSSWKSLWHPLHSILPCLQNW